MTKPLVLEFAYDKETLLKLAKATGDPDLEEALALVEPWVTTSKRIAEALEPAPENEETLSDLYSA